MTRSMGTLLGALSGTVAALVLGFVWIALAPDNGFGDLAAAAVTRILLLPTGALVGALVGYRRAST